MKHWPEYVIEGAALGAFMVSAGSFAILLLRVANPIEARALMGVAMGLTAISIIKSPFGQRSGAHMNPAVTLTFYRLGKIASRDAIAYVAAQFIGGALGLFALSLIARDALRSVHFVATTPGEGGALIAFAAECLISFVLMSVVLRVSNSPTLARHTPLFAGALVALFILFEAPYSGMSMNPARTFASALAAGDWNAIWIYLTAPLLGMLTAAAIYRGRVYCAKLNHYGNARCIFRCAFAELTPDSERRSPSTSRTAPTAVL